MGRFWAEGKRSYPEEILTFSNEIQDPTEDLIKSLPIESSQDQTSGLIWSCSFMIKNNPIHIVNFLDMETKEGGILFEKAISAAKHWQYVLEGLILQADQLAGFQSEITQEQEMAEAAP